MFFSSKTSKNSLKIIIIGLGKVGRTLTEQLSNEKHNITVIDIKDDRVADMTDQFDVAGFIGNGASYKLQQEAGIDDADLLIAVTGSDELNLLCCTMAKQNEKCATIARVRTPEYSMETSFLRERLGLSMIINPELEASREIAKILALPSALDVFSFSGGNAEMIEFKIPDGNVLDGLKMFELPNKLTLNQRVLICALKREDEVIIPNGQTVLQAGDVISVLGAKRFYRNFLKAIGITTRQVRDCMIVGGGDSAYYLAASLINSGIDVKIIERDKFRCEELTTTLPGATIINGDGTDESLLREEGIEYAESFVPLTGIDESNVILTLFANQISNAKAITKINMINFSSVLERLDLGSIVFPRFVTSEAIIAYVRAKSASKEKNINTLYHLYDQRVEAIEFYVDEKCPVTDVPLMQLQLKDNCLIGFINRKGRIIFPSGNDMVQVGDYVMIVTTHTGFTNINEILR